MKILKKALLYDITNMAYVIADNGDPRNHSLHRVRDICEDGNIDRVSRVLGLAYSNILSVLLPVLAPPAINLNKDNSAKPHDYEICFKSDIRFLHSLTPERKLKIKETAHEYMVCMALADWLGVTYPEAAEVWRFRTVENLNSLAAIVATVMSGTTGCMKRRLYPF